MADPGPSLVYLYTLKVLVLVSRIFYEIQETSKYNNANFQGIAFYEKQKMKDFVRLFASRRGNTEKAAKLIYAEQTYFDYVDLGAGPRPIKMLISGSVSYPSCFSEFMTFPYPS